MTRKEQPIPCLSNVYLLTFYSFVRCSRLQLHHKLDRRFTIFLISHTHQPPSGQENDFDVRQQTTQLRCGPGDQYLSREAARPGEEVSGGAVRVHTIEVESGQGRFEEAEHCWEGLPVRTQRGRDIGEELEEDLGLDS